MFYIINKSTPSACQCHCLELDATAETDPTPSKTAIGENWETKKKITQPLYYFSLSLDLSSRREMTGSQNKSTALPPKIVNLLVRF